MSYKFHAPNVSETDRDAIAAPVDGMLIYNTDRDRFEFYEPFWGWHPVALTQSAMRDWGVETLWDGSSSDSYWSTGTQGTGTGLNSGANILPTGIWNATFITGTTATGTVRLATGSLVFGNGLIRNESLIRHITLSTLAERYVSIIGFQDTFGSENQVDGIYFLYDEGGVSTGGSSSVNWQCVTASNSSRTFTTTGVAVSNSTLQKLRIDINADATRVNFYIDDVLAGVHSTNIPSGTSRIAQCGAMAVKKTGTTSTQTIISDYLYLKAKFTTPR